MSTRVKKQPVQLASPLQSQAGRVNRKFNSGSTWWLNKTQFRKFGFYVYE